MFHFFLLTVRCTVLKQKAQSAFLNYLLMNRIRDLKTILFLVP